MSDNAAAVPAAEISGLGISYRAAGRRVDVVRDVSFSLPIGRTLGLVGESGSGKSTTARTLLGHLRDGSRIDAGSVRVLGEDVFALPPERLRQLRGGSVGLVAQNAGHALTPSMTVGDQVAETLAGHGLPHGTDRLTELFDLVRLPSPRALLRRYPHELSGGQQQRAAIAMAVSTDPRLLVLDEPTTALDVITQAAVLSLINELQERLGMAVLIVSHDLGVVSAVADEVLVLKDGTEVESGPTDQVLRSPRTDYTRVLLEAAPRVHGSAVSRDEIAEAPLVSCRGLQIRYPGAERRAVNGVDLTLRRGETLAVVGESGSGKSTIATALAGLVALEGGSAELVSADGARLDLSKPPHRRPVAARRAMQLIFQNADLALNPRRSVGDAIGRALRVFDRAHGGTSIRRDVERLLSEVGLTPAMADRVPAQLSGGQRQRVGIARALAADPELLIADEVTTALDVSVQAEVLELLEGLRSSRGLSCLFISHDLAVVRNVADRVMVMRSGVVVESAPTDVLFDDPRHPYTKALMDAVVEPGHHDLPSSDADTIVPVSDPDSHLRDLGNGHLVRNDEGVAVA
ncbi:dipeptide ABC transporter ATP-binding protein [Naumannella halotolerans]|uniref:dipeptide ABC transporter ATP-binding protein n=1 Tax=Naumannella halotolerans TaxID=993414 RepID=UPI00370D8D37